MDRPASEHDCTESRVAKAVLYCLLVAHVLALVPILMIGWAQ
jgi:hypothetical protein